MPVSLFHLDIDDTDPNKVHMQNKPLSSYLIHQSGCPATYPTAIIPKYLPYIEETLYYVVGHDSFLNLGLKAFAYTVNASHALLDSCQKKLINVEIKMKTNTSPLPHFIVLDRSSDSILVNNPTAADVGTYLI